MLKLNFTPFPQLETERMILRQITEADAEQFYSIRCDERVMKYIHRPRPKSIDDIYLLIEKISANVKNNGGISWAMTLKEEKKFIGSIGYHQLYPENYRAEVGYHLAFEHWGKGLTNEALRKIIAFGFQQLKFHSIEANVYPSNSASIKLLEKNNFVKEAYFKENFFFNGEFLDSAVYSLLTPHKTQA